MNTVTIHVNRNSRVIGYRVTLSNITGTHVVSLKESDFKAYAGAEANFTGDEVATVADFPARPKFIGELSIGAGGGGRATATFHVDGERWQPILVADYHQTKDRKEITP